MISKTRDIGLYESGSGGDFSLLNNDLVLSESLFNTIYIALFGGNIESSTIGNELPTEERNDYWANELVFKNNVKKQFNSDTERALNNNVINSSGRIIIEQCVKSDLVFLSEIVAIDVNVSIARINTIEISLQLKSKLNQSVKNFQFVWNNAKREVVINKRI